MAVNAPKREGAGPPPKTSTEGTKLPPEVGMDPRSFTDPVEGTEEIKSSVPPAEKLADGERVWLRGVPVVGAKQNWVHVPKHPVNDPITGDRTRWRNGRVPIGEVFLWHGTDKSWPDRCEVVDGPAVDEFGEPRQVTVLERARIFSSRASMAQARGRAASGGAVRAPETLPQPSGLGGSSLPL